MRTNSKRKVDFIATTLAESSSLKDEYHSLGSAEWPSGI